MRTQIITDQDLVRQYLGGRSEAIETLINRHKDKVYSYILLMTKDEHVSEDVFQDCFIKVINTLKRGKYNEEGKFLPWVMRIAHNLVIDHFRKSKKMPSANAGRRDDDYDIFSTISNGDATIEEDMVWDQIRDDVRKVIDLLPDEQREVVLMRHYQGLSFKEISELTGVSINTALGRMRYALINLRRIIKEKDMIMTAQ